MSNMDISASELFNFLQGSDISGESSFDIWKSLNPEGTIQQFLTELKGKSSYEVWKSLPGNENKTEEEYFEAVRGKSSYEVWKSLPGNENKTEEEYFDSLKIISSNYDLWLSIGNEGTAEDFLNFLKGERGDSAYELWLKQEGNAGKTEEDFLNSTGGTVKIELPSDEEILNMFTEMNLFTPATDNNVLYTDNNGKVFIF